MYAKILLVCLFAALPVQRASADTVRYNLPTVPSHQAQSPVLPDKLIWGTASCAEPQVREHMQFARVLVCREERALEKVKTSTIAQVDETELLFLYEDPEKQLTDMVAKTRVNILAGFSIGNSDFSETEFLTDHGG